MSKVLPKISIVVPTFNEEKNIGICLRSIYQQNYPRNKLEVFVIDDYSTDETVRIARKFPVKIMYSGKHHGEVSKMIGFKKSTGKYFMYFDADVEIGGRDFFQKMILPLEFDTSIVASFTNEGARSSDPALERFLSFDTLQRDSLYQFFSSSVESTIIEKQKGYFVCNYLLNKIPPSGRCLYRRLSLLNLVKKYDIFLELDFLIILVMNKYSRFAYIPSAHLYHHHAPSLKVLIRKRMYNVKNVYLRTRSKKLYTWFDLTKRRDQIKLLSWILYVHLILPSVLVGMYKSLKHRDGAGLYEPIVNVLVTDAILFAFLTNRSTIKLFKRTVRFRK